MDPPPQTLDDIRYELPEDSIAQTPLERRDEARLLIDDGVEIRHSRVAALPELLREGDLVVVNNTRVLKARVRLRRPTGGAAEVLLLEQLDEQRWEALVRPSRKLKEGSLLRNDAMAVVIGEDLGDGRRIVEPQVGDLRLMDVLEEVGLPPLPPYIERRISDPERYQTVFGQRPLSAAAPTAGLHLTESVFAGLEAKGVRVGTVELAVGLDTFRPMTVDRLDDHVMHSEWYSIPAATRQLISSAERVVAVGTTTVRALETWGHGAAPEGRSSLFIRRPFDWSVVEVMMTNFHLPASTLLCMIDAFVGPRWREIYAEALAHGYRFLSFGDAMLCERGV
ncbi:MAG: tRNA preQ1(34) S-adenosylmethionine ribosyltransferase-isomerase QueA [Acidimicrobiaceae bacterium]|nr:tRNA preQ1(34) S-adenosylmethionine ribosyltransferase-isomerase QueA [Acidimicrobiaceae bacterium]MDE0607592.1 tRNA preQ1(34) S-adenosylmethionine ribosyltransferase-isomerase QueA [Acidimicrobiaceae bacterium]